MRSKKLTLFDHGRIESESTEAFFITVMSHTLYGRLMISSVKKFYFLAKGTI
jgi:hypothetical protein